jgi:hypothetical protein
MTQRLAQEVCGNLYTGLITPMPGSPDTAVSHGVYLLDGKKGKGTGTQANRMRLAQVAELGYTSIICFVCENNRAQNKVLSNAGWSCCDKTIYNPRTGNHLRIWVRDLTPALETSTESFLVSAFKHGKRDPFSRGL